ncbi:carbohydrate kinase [Actinopolyspora erythraea]|uniref:Carbohydrate kinase n=1 Tax=Actinopolyspora erythraea TaxID=414996 RepID=A0A099D3H1_9ACTN|nr:carbohydrate kinase [Actinopolyspora erythraea]ASU77426.1 carbohydrate kinase [Actinopolyspora erythraea]KGI80362.1 sugar kinase [Actinopolyspora erythraea]
MILICGEALVDLVPGEAGAGELAPLHPRLGGGPYNVTIALGRLSTPVGMFTRLSGDRFGVKLLERLHEAGVDTTEVQVGAEPTTLAVVELDERGAARYGFHTEGTAAPLVEEPGELPSEVEALCFGTLAMVLEPGASVHERLLFREAERGRFTALDPNIRADLIGDPAAYRRRFHEWLPAVDLLKLSVEDAAWLAGSEPASESPELFEALRDWLGRGPAAVVLTRGADGIAVLTGDGGLVEVDAAEVPVVDTIGAGDTIQAALLCWLHRAGALSDGAVRALSEADWRAALSFAAAAAGVTVSRRGAEPPYASEL